MFCNSKFSQSRAPLPNKSRLIRFRAEQQEEENIQMENGADLPGKISSNKVIIKYCICVAWAENMSEKVNCEGQVELFSSSVKQIQKMIQSHLRNKIPLKNGYTIELNVDLKNCHKKVICLTQKGNQSRAGYATGLIVQKKINLPSGYTSIPNSFKGFILDNLSIKNQHGCISWSAPINVEDVDFSSGLQIGRHEIDLEIEKLQIPCVVEFYRIPAKIQSYGKKYGSEKMTAKLKKYAGSQGCKFIYYDLSTGHWIVELGFDESKFSDCYKLEDDFQKCD